MARVLSSISPTAPGDAAGRRLAASARRRLVAPERVLALAPPVALAVLMLLFTGWFSVYAIRLHDAHLTHKADLGQIDQAIWNTAHGRPVQEVVDETVRTRLTDHVEPIFLPLSLIYWLWDDVRALLLAQAMALALGALPVYLLARGRLRGLGYGAAAAWGGLVLAAAYLLAPALQAAAVSEFHAFGLAPPLVAWALWAVERRRWLQMVVAAVLVMAVQEGLALLGALLGLYALGRALARPGGAAGGPWEGEGWARRRGILAGLAVFAAGLAWFYITTFVIIPHFAAQAYGIQQTPYAARYGPLGDSFGDVLKSLVLRPGLVLGILGEPLRARYLVGLLAPTGFLALLAPEILALSLPLLLANALSTFPFQYAGELHYSAPLVPYFAVAGAVGLARLLALVRRGGHKVGEHKVREGESKVRPYDGAGMPRPAAASRLLAVLLGLVLVTALGWQYAAGYTPLGREYWLRVPGGWPEVTDHDRLLDRFLAQIPASAPGSTTADLYPHLAHRELLYEFPAVGRATWALVDVSGTTDRHPADIRAGIDRLLALGWGVVDAADGYVLLSAAGGAAAIPPAFYDFARAPDARPQHVVDITFGGTVRLLGYDVVENEKWRSTTLRYYWQALAALPADTTLTIEIVAPDGTVGNTSSERPLPALYWYPPSSWQAGETVVVASQPWYLPAAWVPVVSVSAGGIPLAPQGCNASPESSAGSHRVSTYCLPDDHVRLADTKMPALAPGLWAGAATPMESAGIRFAGADWQIELARFALPARVAPGKDLRLQLAWSSWGGGMPGPAGRDYTVFVHLRKDGTTTIANADATPTWYVAMPTSRWPVYQEPISWAPESTLDAHTLRVPADLAPGRYSVVVGWYDWQSGARLQVVGGAGNAGAGTPGAGNDGASEYVLGDVVVDPGAAQPPDLACLLTAEACASQ